MGGNLLDYRYSIVYAVFKFTSTVKYEKELICYAGKFEAA